jgi:hypothetical protein
MTFYPKIEIMFLTLNTTLAKDAVSRMNDRMFSNAGSLTDDTKQKLDHQCQINANTNVRDHVVVIKFTNIAASTVEALRSRTEGMALSDKVKRTILSCLPQNVHKGNTFSYVYEFMLVYLIHKSEFDTVHTVIEPQTQSCLTRLSFENAYGHPLDMRKGLIDVSPLEDPYDPNQPLYLNFFIVYHNHEFDDRFININGRVYLVPQFQDTTRKEGFYISSYHIAENARGMTYEDGFIPLYIENYIKNSGIEIGIMSKKDFPDGFTETTHISNLVVLENLVTDALCLLTTEKVLN